MNVLIVDDEPLARERLSRMVGELEGCRVLQPCASNGEEALALIDSLNADPKVHGILVQLPLPSHLNSELVINRIDPAKDVDGFHISNVGLLGTGQKSMVPCTPLGCLMMLRDHHGSLAGLNAVVVGRSNIVGKPMAQLLLGDSCTVTIAHSRTKDLAAVCRSGAGIGAGVCILAFIARILACITCICCRRLGPAPLLLGHVQRHAHGFVAGVAAVDDDRRWRTMNLQLVLFILLLRHRANRTGKQPGPKCYQPIAGR